MREDHRQKVIRVDGRRFNLDAYDPTTNTVYEFFGNYWHGNPDVFAADTANSTVGITHGELYARALDKIWTLEKAGYNVVHIWEHDWNTMTKV